MTSTREHTARPRCSTGTAGGPRVEPTTPAAAPAPAPAPAGAYAPAPRPASATARAHRPSPWPTPPGGATGDPDLPRGGSADEVGGVVVRAVVALHRRRETDAGIEFDELPIAVGFGSLHKVRPSRLHAVPIRPLELVAPSSAAPAPAGSDVLSWPGGREYRRPGPSGSPAWLATPTEVGGRSGAAVRPTPGMVDPSPLRLTARGRAVLLIVAAAVGMAVVVSSWFGAGAGAGAAAPTPAAPPARVVVHSGDTLWTIAGRIAPNRDPRAVVDQLLRVNHLNTPALVPGQVLRTH